MKRREFLKLAALSPLGFFLPSWLKTPKVGYGYVSWKTYPATVILNEDWLARVEINSPIFEDKILNEASNIYSEYNTNTMEVISNSIRKA